MHGPSKRLLQQNLPGAEVSIRLSFRQPGFAQAVEKCLEALRAFEAPIIERLVGQTGFRVHGEQPFNPFTPLLDYADRPIR